LEKIRIGIVGYGNLGKGAELGIRQNKDMERRNPNSIKPLTEGVKVYSVDSARDMADKIDVMLLCSGSRTDLPVQGPEFAAMFNIVDGFYS